MRPHDVSVSLVPEPDAIEAMIARVVYLGFEVRIELELPDGSFARAQLTRAQTDELELARGDIVYVRPPLGATAEPSVLAGGGPSALAGGAGAAPPATLSA